MGAGGEGAAAAGGDAVRIVSVDGNLMVVKAAFPVVTLTRSSGDDSEAETPGERGLDETRSSTASQSLRRCKTSVDLAMHALDPTPAAAATEADADAERPPPRLTAGALRRHDRACEQRARLGGAPPEARAAARPAPRRGACAPACGFLWFLGSRG